MATRTEWENAGRFLASLPAGRAGLLCAVSGGLDSMCLLHFARSWGAARGVSVSAAHFNHGLRGEAADRDEAFVQEWCAARGIRALFGRGDARKHAEEAGLSLEEAARDLRYAFLEETARAEGFASVLTAHHADDNAETILFHLIRGTGLRGLTGIPRRRGVIARPFLELTRADLEDYAAAWQIPHVEDETNAADDASRNVLRHQVLPVLETLNPRTAEHIGALAQRLRRDEEALCAMAEALLAEADVQPGVCAFLPAACWADCPEAVLHRALGRLLGLTAGCRKDLSAAHIEAVEALCRAGGGQADLPCGMTARRTAAGLALERREAPPAARPVGVGETVAFGAWRVTLDDSGAPNLSLPEGAETAVTAWRREDRLRLPGAKGSRSFKRLCKDRGLAPFQRDALPVLRIDGRAAAAPGIGTEQAFAPGTHAIPVRVTFTRCREEETDEQ